MGKDRPGVAKAKRPVDLLEDAVEGGEHGQLVRTVLNELDALLDDAERHATLRWGNSTQGGATLIRADGPGSAEAMQIAWNHSKIERIEIEPRSDFRFEELANAVPLDDTLVGLLWRHVREGGVLPRGSERFAVFFSGPPTREAPGAV